MAPSKRPRSVKSQFLSPLLPALRALCELLKNSHKQGMIIGGVASSLLGHPRLTMDIDATAMIGEKDIDQFLIKAAAAGFSPRRRDSVEFMQESAMLLLQHDVTGVPIDINQARLPFEELATKKAKTKRYRGISIPLPTPEDLIVMKAVAHRPKDLEDIRGIVESQARLDLAYIRKRVQDFGHALDMPELWDDIKPLLKERSVRKGKELRRRGRGTPV